MNYLNADETNLGYSDLDVLSTFETAGAHVLATQVPVRYAVRQVLDQELHKTKALRETAARQARFRAGGSANDETATAMDLDMMASSSNDKENAGQKGRPVIAQPLVKKDFFGRVIVEKAPPLHETDGNSSNHKRKGNHVPVAEHKVWVTYHEGLNNAVRKPLALEEFMKDL